MDVSVEHFNRMMLRYVGKDESRDPVTKAMTGIANSKGDIYSLHEALPALRPLFECTYQVGAIGFIFPPVNNVRWVGNQMDNISISAIDLGTTIAIHPMLHDALGINVSVGLDGSGASRAVKAHPFVDTRALHPPRSLALSPAGHLAGAFRFAHTQ